MTYRHFNNESTRSSVLRAVANTENEVAWQRLFDLYAGFVFSIARSKGLNDADADDIVQVVFADMARNMPTFRYDREKGCFRSYLSGLVHWRVKDKLKAARRDADMMAAFCEEAKTEASSGGEDFEQREWQAAALEEALRRIRTDVRPEHYAAFVASAVEGQDTETVTRLYGLTSDNLYQIRKRLTAKLRETVEQVLREMDAPEPTVDGDKVVLRQAGKSITLVQCGAQKGTWSVGDGQGPNKWDSPNSGCRQLMFTVSAKDDGAADVAVNFSF